METTEANSTRRRWTDYFWQPQAALAGIVFMVAVLAGVVVLGLRDGNNEANSSDATDNGNHVWQTDHAEDIPRAALRSHVYPVEQTTVDQPSGNSTSYRNGRENTLQTTPGEAEMTTGQTMPNRPISVGNGPLAGIESANWREVRPNFGARLASQDEQAGVAELKGVLQHQIMAEATNERDRPGLR